MWTLQQGETTHWTLFIQQWNTHTKLNPSLTSGTLTTSLLMLTPAYRPLLKLAKPVQKQITVWPENATSALQDCFQDTDWNMFKEAATYNNHTDLQDYTETVTAYIKNCIDDMTVTKIITTCANQKPWMTTAEVCELLKTRDEAFRSGDKAALKTCKSQSVLWHQKWSYAQKNINNHFTDSRDTWSKPFSGKPFCHSVASHSDHHWLQAPATGLWWRHIPPRCTQPLLFTVWNAEWHTCTKTAHTSRRSGALSRADVRKTLSRTKPRKAAGPDSIPGRVLKDCVEQLTDVLTHIFNTSLSQAVIPTCLKSTIIITVPKKSPVSCLNDYCPIALTPIIMKWFERLVMHNIKTSLPNTLDPLQFAYRPNRSTDDAISSTLYLALTYLENKDSYVRMLFIDFSSAFNTIIPQHLINKLSLLGLNNSLCNWILDFLTGRPQSVRVGLNTSSTTILSTGAPQGCVLSPLLFTVLTHDCTAKFSSNHIIKFADDTSVVGLISNNDEMHYREEVAQLAEWCGANNLSLNMGKKKEVVMDFRRNSVDHPPLTIDSSTVERVSSTKFLGVHITEDLTWTTNTTSCAEIAEAQESPRVPSSRTSREAKRHPKTLLLPLHMTSIYLLMHLFIYHSYVLFIIYAYFNQFNYYYWYHSQKLQKGGQQQGLEVLEHVPEEHQTLLTSATIPTGTEPSLTRDPVSITIGQKNQPCANRDSPLGGGAVKEKEAFWDFKCEYTVETTFKNWLNLLAGVFVFWGYVWFICDNRKLI